MCEPVCVCICMHACVHAHRCGPKYKLHDDQRGCLLGWAATLFRQDYLYPPSRALPCGLAWPRACPLRGAVTAAETLTRYAIPWDRLRAWSRLGFEPRQPFVGKLFHCLLWCTLPPVVLRGSVRILSFLFYPRSTELFWLQCFCFNSFWILYELV